MTPYALQDVRIDGFRGLRQLSLESLGLINILVGGNNSGKTSVLEAICVLCSPMDPSEWLTMVRRRDFGGLDETRLQSLRWCFSQANKQMDPDTLQEGNCELSCNGRFNVRISAHYSEIYGEPSQAELKRAMAWSAMREPASPDGQWRGAQLSHTVFVGPAYVPIEEPVEPLVLWENVPMRPVSRTLRIKQNQYALSNETLTPYSYQISRLQISSHSRQLVAAQRKDAILELIRKFDPNVMDINIASFRGVRPAINLVHKNLGSAPLSIFGDALRRAVLLANTIYSLKGGGVLLLDELETGIHVRALDPVFSWLTKTAAELGVQIIATTHSLEAVDGILDSTENPSNIVTYHIEQTNRGTEAKRIPGDMAKRLRLDRGLDIR